MCRARRRAQPPYGTYLLLLGGCLALPTEAVRLRGRVRCRPRRSAWKGVARTSAARPVSGKLADWHIDASAAGWHTPGGHTKRQTRREAGTQSHGPPLEGGSRAAERSFASMNTRTLARTDACAAEGHGAQGSQRAPSRRGPRHFRARPLGVALAALIIASVAIAVAAMADAARAGCAGVARVHPGENPMRVAAAHAAGAAHCDTSGEDMATARPRHRAW
jgi:hypothetical protein